MKIRASLDPAALALLLTALFRPVAALAGAGTYGMTLTAESGRELPADPCVLEANFTLAERERRPRGFSARQAIRAYASTFRLYPQENERCTAVSISDQGYFVTASHCLSACMRAGGAFVETPAGQGTDTYLATHLARLRRTRCRVSLTGRFNGQDEKTIRLVAAGAGILAPESERRLEVRDPDLVQHLAERGIGLGADFVVARFEDPTARTGPCLPLAAHPLRSGQPVTVLGYPGRTMRSVNRVHGKSVHVTGPGDSDGSSLYFDTGLVDRNILDTPCWKNVPVPWRQHILLAPTLSPSLLNTEADSWEGDSGAPALTPGEIGGIVTSTQSTDTQQCRGSTLAIQAATIRSEIERQAPEEAARALSCGEN